MVSGRVRERVSGRVEDNRTMRREGEEVRGWPGEEGLLALWSVLLCCVVGVGRVVYNTSLWRVHGIGKQTGYLFIA